MAGRHESTRPRSAKPGRPDVSVVIPTRNRWDKLRRLGLKAALSQRDVTVEVIVVDDGSDLPSPGGPMLDDPRVKVVRHERQSGVCAARNTGIQHAQADWIAFLDDDDMWAPNKLASVIGAAGDSGADFGYSSAVVLDRDWQPIEIAEALPFERLRERLRNGDLMPAGGSNVVAKASLLERMGGWDEAFWAMDW